MEAAGRTNGKREKTCTEHSSAREKDDRVVAAFWDASWRRYLLFDDVKCCVEGRM